MGEFFSKGESKGILNVHLMSGEDIIGEVYEIDRIIRIVNPSIPNVQMSEDGHMRVGLLPLRPYLGETKEVFIELTKVLYTIPAGERMERMYQQVHNKVQLASPTNLQQLLTK